MASPNRRTAWAEAPKLPADQVRRILREKLLVPPKIVAIALDRHPNSINKAIKDGTIPTVGTGRSRRVPTEFVRDYLGLSSVEADNRPPVIPAQPQAA